MNDGFSSGCAAAFRGPGRLVSATTHEAAGKCRRGFISRPSWNGVPVFRILAKPVQSVESFLRDRAYRLPLVARQLGISFVKSREVVLDWRKDLIFAGLLRCHRNDLLKRPSLRRCCTGHLKLSGPSSPQPQFRSVASIENLFSAAQLSLSDESRRIARARKHLH